MKEALRTETRLRSGWRRIGCRPPPVQSCPRSSIDEIMTILRRRCPRPLEGRSCACFSPACMHCMRTVRRENSVLLHTHTLSGLRHVCRQLKPALTPTVHHLSSLFRNQDIVSPLFMCKASPHISVRTRKRREDGLGSRLVPVVL